MFRYLDFEVVIKLNYFPVKGSLSPCYSAQTVLDQQPLKYKTNFKIPFGKFIQGNNDNNPTSSNVSQTIDGIYLQSLDKIQVGNEIFDLHSHIVITRWKILENKIAMSIIKNIKEMETRDKVTSPKFKIRAGVIYDNDWIAGVEYENENEDYSEEDKEYVDYK